MPENPKITIETSTESTLDKIQNILRRPSPAAPEEEWQDYRSRLRNWIQWMILEDEQTSAYIAHKQLLADLQKLTLPPF